MPSSPATTQPTSGMPGMHFTDQTSRLTTIPGSKLVLASFDQSAASGLHALSQLSIKDGTHTKRIVVEIPPTGPCRWKFVPRASWEEGVVDEGLWPRDVDLCGKIVRLSQDEWELYKLDPDYICIVRNPPQLTTILWAGSITGRTKAQAAVTDESNERPTSLEHPLTEENNHRSPVPPLRVRIGKVIPPARKVSNSSRKASNSSRGLSTDDDDDDEEEGEVSDMMLDEASEGGPQRRMESEILRKVRANKAAARRFRRSKNAQFKRNHPPQWTDDLSDVHMGTPRQVSPMAGPSTVHRPKRREMGDGFPDDSSESSDDDRRTPFLYERNGPTKRKKTMSPEAINRKLKYNRILRKKKRQEEKSRRFRTRSEGKHDVFMKDIFSEFTADTTLDDGDDDPEADNEDELSPHNDERHSSSNNASKTPLDEDASRQAEIEKSRRKLAELESDRPLWEEAARKRKAEEDDARRREEAARRARKAEQDAHKSASQHAEQLRASERSAGEQQRQQQQQRTALRQKREQAQQRAKATIARLRFISWSYERAFERYVSLCEEFDRANFHRDDVCVFEAIPWPMLPRPGSFGVEDIDWQGVEAFFRYVRGRLGRAEFKALVEKSHRRFHPDRWRSRRVLASVEDEEERTCLELAANTVAQALTPLWHEVTGR